MRERDPGLQALAMKDGGRPVALVNKINALVHIGRLSGLSVIYPSIS